MPAALLQKSSGGHYGPVDGNRQLHLVTTGCCPYILYAIFKLIIINILFGSVAVSYDQHLVTFFD